VIRRFVCLAAIPAFALVGLTSVGALAARPAATISIHGIVQLTASENALMRVGYSCTSPPGSRPILGTSVTEPFGALSEAFPPGPATCDGVRRTVTTINRPHNSIGGLLEPGRATATAFIGCPGCGGTLARVVRTVEVRAPAA
jgi:hypothetical protein